LYGGGFIAIHRKIRESWLWRSGVYNYFQAWTDLIMEVCYMPQKRVYKGELYELKRGEMLYSLQYLGERWGWSTTKVEKFLSILETDKAIKRVKKKGNSISRLTICQYDIYNPPQDAPQNLEKTSKKLRKEESNNTNKTNKKEVYTRVFDFWNKQNVIKHRKLHEKDIARINGALTEFTEQEILEGIRNYANILCSDRYYFNYKWTLRDFLMRGLRKFVSAAQPFGNYAKDRNQEPEPLDSGVSRVVYKRGRTVNE